jgi:hypothetical protein
MLDHFTIESIFSITLKRISLTNVLAILRPRLFTGLAPSINPYYKTF